MSILLIGTGRMAFHLGHALKRANLPLVGLVGRDAQKVSGLADQLGCASFSLGEALPLADLRIIAVRDDAIAEVAAQLPGSSGVTVHTSGARRWEVIKGHAHRGVLWPVQSLSPGLPMDLSATPFVIDAEDDQARSTLRSMAGQLSSTVLELAHEKRELVHLSAVLASNFPVYLLMEAERLLQREGLPPTIVHSLWKSSTAKALDGAEQALTGPAKRGDLHTIQAHLDRLTSDADLRRAYARLSAMILKAYGHPTDGLEDVQGDPR